MLLIITGCLLGSAHAQDQPEHKKKAFKDEEERLYWNRHMPVYISLSNTPERDDEVHQMVSHTDSKEYAEPYFFDTEGVNYIRTRWAVDRETHKTVYPKREVLWEIYADGLAPTSSIDYANTEIISKKGNLYLQKGTKIVLSAKDGVSGVEDTYYSINEEPYRAYTDSITLNEESKYSIRYYAVDKVGNVEKVKTTTVIIDGSMPHTGIEIAGTGYNEIYTSEAIVKLTATDGSVGLKYTKFQIDNNKEQVYQKGGIYLRGISEGEHTITYYSVDNLGNREEKQRKTIFIDDTPPMISSEILGDRYVRSDGKAYSSGRSRLKLVAVDNKAGVKGIYYAINGGEYQEYTQPVNLPKSSGGLTIDFYALDHVDNKSSGKGNEGSNSMKMAMDMDLTGPGMSYNFEGNRFNLHDTTFINDQTRVAFNATDGESGLWKITFKGNEDTDYSDYSEPLTFKEEGYYELLYQGYDNVMNTNTDTCRFFVDKSGPEIFAKFGMPAVDIGSVPVYPHHATLFLSASDRYVGFKKMYFSINGSKEFPYTGKINGFDPGKEYTVKARAVDKLGNSRYKTIRFKTEKGKGIPAR